MSKSKQKARKQATASAAPESTPATPAPQTLVVLKKDSKFRGAREAWYKRLVEHDGKPVDAYLTSCKDQPPSVPKSGKVENPTGWLSYFRRQGLVEVKATG